VRRVDLVHNATVAAMSTFLGIVIAAISILTVADGEEVRAVQKRLGIRRRTRLGR